MYDIIIVGAGPSGSSLAYFLAQSNLKVLLLDMFKFPREKPCGGAVTYTAVEKFPFLKELMEIPYYYGETHYREDFSPISNTSKTPMGYFVRRFDFDYALLKCVPSAKIDIQLHQRVVDIRTTPEKITVICSDNIEYESKIVVGADGTNSIIREKTSLKRYWRKDKISFIIMNEIEYDADRITQFYTDLHKSFIHLCFKNTTGYGWIFSKKTCVNIGYGALLKEQTTQSIFQNFQIYEDYCIKNGFLPQPNTKKRPRSWLLPSGGPSKHFASQGIFLIGDAAGFVQPVSGEGIKYAIWSAQILSEVLIKHFTEHQPLTKTERCYEQRCLEAFGTDLRIIAKLMTSMKKTMGMVFKLAKNDPQIGTLQDEVFNGSQRFTKVIWKFMVRMLVDICKGYLWKK